jgi:hypothetical protein
MENKLPPGAQKLGYWSALLASVLSIMYLVGQLAEWCNLLGSGGGPENPSTASGLIVLLLPSLLLAPCFALMMLCVHYYAPEEKKIWSHAGILFATIYAVMVSINY